MNSRPHNILILTAWPLEDGLIGRYVLPYLAIIGKNIPPDSKLYLVTFEKTKHADSTQMNRSRLAKQNIVWVPIPYYPFGVKAIFQYLFIIPRLLWLIFRRGIREIHPWCTPPGVLGVILSLFSGRHLILDSYEPHAEPMIESGTWKRNSVAYRVLFFFEKWMGRSASVIIGANEKMPVYVEKKFGFYLKHFYWKPACVNLIDFQLSKRKNKTLMDGLGLHGKIVAVYAGKFGGSYLEHEIFELAKIAHEFWGNSFRFLVLNGQKDDYITELVTRANFDSRVLIKCFVPYEQVPDYMGLGDFGIVPFKPVPSKKYGSPIKTGEYLALGLPVIITKDISNDSFIIQKYQAGSVLKKLSKSDYKLSIQRINELLNKENHYQSIRDIAKKHYNFNAAEQVYRDIYRKKLS